MKHTVEIKVIEIYHVKWDAESKSSAVEQARDMFERLSRHEKSKFHYDSDGEEKCI